DDGAGLARAQGVDVLAVFDERGDHALCRLSLVAEEIGGADALLDGKPQRLGRRLARSRPGRARFFALALHGRVEGVGVDGDPARLERILREIEGKAVGIVKRESGFARKLRPAGKSLAALLEQRKPARERLAKPRLFELERLGDQRLGARELAVS